MKQIKPLLLALLLPLLGMAQTQTIRGTVIDADSQFPLPGVSVVVLGIQPTLGAVTDMDGNFRLANVPVGRQNLQVQYIGYKSQTLSNIVVTAGKEVILNVQLVESVELLDEVVVTAENEKDRPVNELAKVSARTFSLEEVTRFSGGRNDVARLAANFAGVNTADDSRNDIVVRGNSPTGLLWRVDGLPMPTTNHFATFGTTGGPVSALNTNLLKTSDFMTGAFPAEYGNASAAVFDVKFRNGNTEKFEFTGQASAFSGLEAMAEGPINRKNGSSFLVSYRYGIASLAATGTSATPYYQDLSFKLNLGRSKLGLIEIFGMGGRNSIDFLGDEIQEDDLFADPFSDSYFKGSLGMIGLNHTVRFSEKAYLKTTIGATAVASTFEQDNLMRDSATDATISKYRATEAEDVEARYTFGTQYNKKYSARFNLRAGVLAEMYNISSQVNDRDRRADIPDTDGDGIPDYFIPVRDVNRSTLLSQAYAQGEYKFSDALSWTFGLHGQHLELTNDAVLEPRTGLSYELNKKNRLSFAYGLHAQLVPLPILTYREEVASGVFETTNDELEFTKSHHFVLGYDWKFAPSWRLKSEVYYQYLFDVPVDQFASSYASLNEGSAFVYTERGSLVNEGSGSNYGLELTLEKFFSQGYYMLATASLYDSKYTGSDGIERQTAFNNQYVLNFLAGKEWNLSERTALTFDTRFVTSGGRPFTPVDLEATRQNGGREVLMEDQAFSQRLDDYMRLDVKFGFRLNSGKISHQFFVDLQNVTNRQNVFTERYNPVTDQIDPVYQIGFFPDFMYRIQF